MSRPLLFAFLSQSFSLSFSRRRRNWYITHSIGRELFMIIAEPRAICAHLSFLFLTSSIGINVSIHFHLFLYKVSHYFLKGRGGGLERLRWLGETKRTRRLQDGRVGGGRSPNHRDLGYMTINVHLLYNNLFLKHGGTRRSFLFEGEAKNCYCCFRDLRSEMFQNCLSVFSSSLWRGSCGFGLRVWS